MDRAVHEMSSRELLRELAAAGVIEARRPALTTFTGPAARSCVEVRCTRCGFVGVATRHEAHAGALRHEAGAFPCREPGDPAPCDGVMAVLEHQEASRG